MKRNLKDYISLYMLKQDISDCISINEVIKELELTNIKDRKWNVQGATAIDGKGLSEGLDWLAAVLKDKKQEYKKSTNKYNIMYKYVINVCYELKILLLLIIITLKFQLFKI